MLLCKFMVKTIFAFLVFYSFSQHVFANEIPLDRATRVAQNYVNFLSNLPVKRSLNNVKINYTASSTSKRGISSNLFYVFNIVDKPGYVIVAAEDNVSPILAYSSESNFDINTISPQVKYWLSEYEKQISIVISSDITSITAQQEWVKFENGIISYKRGTTAVKPLLKTTWDQSKFYNDSCPYDNTAKKRVYTGCVATAMAQTMKYWSYPTKGTSLKTYTHATYGSLKANFGNTSYGWNNMPNSVTAANMEVARVMFHAGVALSMNYGANGSSAYNSYDPNYSKTPSTHFALQDYFGYDGAKIKSVFKKNFTDQDWLTKMKAELEQGRVVIYEGNDGSTTGHCFVLDGYDANNFIHINWGWSGYYNGYFTFANLVPNGTGSGGGTGNYSSNQGAVIGITPKVSSVPNVDFSASTTSTTVGNLITLSDASTNYPSSWSWTISPNNATFVNGTSNTSKFPEVTFSIPGKYTISLTVSNSVGSNTITKTNYLNVNPQLSVQVCDTITNIEADDTLYYYKVQGKVGFVSGNNSYSDLGCAELFSKPAAYSHISGVLIPFAYAKAANNTDEITLNLHGVTNNLPGTILATKNIKLADISSDISNKKATRIQFDSPIAISGSYFISIIYKYAAGDTVVLSTVLSGNASTNTSFVKYSDGTFHPYTEAWQMKQHLNIQPLVSNLPTANFNMSSLTTFINEIVELDASSSINTYAYNWTLNGASISSSNFYKETISYATAGEYEIKLDAIGGCGNTSSISKKIVVSTSCTSAPSRPGVISGITNICVGQTNTTYSVVPVNDATSYVWTLPSGFTGTSSTNTISVTASNAVQSGDIKVQAVNSCGTSVASTLTLQMDSIPNPGILSIFGEVCHGKTASIKSSVNGGVWTSNDNGIATVDGNGNVTFVSEGTATITYTRTNNSCNAKVSKSIAIGKCLELITLDNQNINIFPNPTQDKLHLQLNSNSFVRYELISPVGNILLSNLLIDKNTTIDVSEYAAGLYLIRVFDVQNKVSHLYFNKN